MPLRGLLGDDSWLNKATSLSRVSLGYAQSWALFRLLMEERPRELRQYLALIHPRRTNDHRLADFADCFGSLARFEARYRTYLSEIAATQVRPER
jgi:hypothetical protein